MDEVWGGRGGYGSLPRLAFSPTSPYETPLLPGGSISAHFLTALNCARRPARQPPQSIDSGADSLTHAIGPIMKFSLSSMIGIKSITGLRENNY